MKDDNIAKHIADAAIALNESVEKIGETFKIANRQIVLSTKYFETISENMKKASEAGELLRQNIIASDLVPEGQVIHYPKEDIIDAIIPAIKSFDYTGPSWLDEIYSERLADGMGVQNEYFIDFTKRSDWSKVFQFRLKKAPRYLRRFR